MSSGDIAEPRLHTDAVELADRIIEALDGRIVLGLPLGLGKATRVANALYARAAADPAINLDIFTALTLEAPKGKSELERRFIDPLRERLFDGCEELAYASALHAGELPANITVKEFFMLAGRWLNNGAAQRSYVSANYTHAVRLIADSGVNVIAQLVSRRGEGAQARYSLSCNSDITLDLLPMLRARRQHCLMVGEVNGALPFMEGEAALPAGDFDHMLETPGTEPRLFAPPRDPVSKTDHAIGIHAASLVEDGGTIQIGIGSLGDAFVAALIMRHKAPELFRETLKRLCHDAVPSDRHTEPFAKGLYGASEMLVEGFMDLYREGILKRTASDGTLVHAGFFLGSEAFYGFLRDLPDDERELFQMRPISFVNALYGDEATKRRDRTAARFVNNAMMATLLGETVSDTLEGGKVVSGIGGQYNFVAQAHELGGARSVITLNATRNAGGGTRSRIVFDYPHASIPRHLRDVFVTEYGVADLRGRSDRDCVAAMIAIADARFQRDLADRARQAGKLEASFQARDKARLANNPEFVERALEPASAAGWCAVFPFGTDFTPVEQQLLPALAFLREETATSPGLAHAVASALVTPVSGGFQEALARMGLAEPQGMSERLYGRLVNWALLRTEQRMRRPVGSTQGS